MKLEKRVPSGREKDEASLQLLEKLREQLYSSNLTLIRQSAFNLSWLQEDGLDILKEALFSDSPRKTKGAATYGLRKMRGRMAKMAVDVIKEGAGSHTPAISKVCLNALSVIRNPKAHFRRPSQSRKRTTRFEIRDIPASSSRQTGRPRNSYRPTTR